MQRTHRAPARSLLVGATLSVASLAVVVVAGCSSTQGGGSLDGEAATAELAGGSATSSAPSQSTQPNALDQVSPTAQGPRRAGSVSEPVVSAQRTQVISDAIKRQSNEMGLTEIHSIRVQSEDPKVSLALVVATRNSVRQVMAASVVKQAGDWVVVNVDTLPDGQNLR